MRQSHLALGFGTYCHLPLLPPGLLQDTRMYGNQRRGEREAEHRLRRSPRERGLPDRGALVAASPGALCDGAECPGLLGGAVGGGLTSPDDAGEMSCR